VTTIISARPRAGQIMLLTAMALVMLLGFVGLAIDVSFFYTSKRHMQIAADAAAVSAAKALRNGGTYGSATQAAKDIAKLNGFDSAHGVTVTAVQPTTSPYNKTGYVQATVAQPEPTFFLKVLGFNSMKVSAGAISGTEDGPACIYALNSSRSSALNLSGNGRVNMACGVVVGSSSSTALTVSGSGSLTATSIGIVGDYSAGGTIKPKPSIHIAPVGDPLASRAPPSVGSCTLVGVTNSNSLKNPQVSNAPVPAGQIYGSGISITKKDNVVAVRRQNNWDNEGLEIRER
jgi:Flp pilus assembly protein TadG